ncbi:MAG: hypothetical protein OEV40_13010, partial [Acidimicrobiia bacterium]|nr:hypothetical protein [Acidimicrobiia bacterium]
ATTAAGLGRANLPVALVPGHVDTQASPELEAAVRSVTVAAVIDNLTSTPSATEAVPEPEADEIVAVGTFDEINARFLEERWSDGLPIVPPTPERIAEFLAYTDRPGDDVLGIVLPDSREVTVRSLAANGVMAGCRPEYMPVLVALGQAMANPAYGVEHSGNTPGSETLITINGPLAAGLGFNNAQGALRDGFIANTSVGRFWRLALRNIAGFLPHETDKATFGNTWRVVLAENEEVLTSIGWPTLAEAFAIPAGENAITISRYTGGNVITSVFGQEAEHMVDYLADALAKQTGWELVFTIGVAGGSYRPLLVLSPVLAETIAASGWSKADLQRALFEKARIPASKFENYLGHWTNLVPGRRSLIDFVNTGKAAEIYATSADPDRLVPIVTEPEHLLIAVAGDPLRTNAYVFSHNGILGFPVAQRIEPMS